MTLHDLCDRMFEQIHTAENIANFKKHRAK